MALRRLLTAAMVLLGSSCPSAAQSAKHDVVVDNSHGPDDIVVVGVPPRCRPRSGDPQDLVDVSSSTIAGRGQQTIQRDPASGGYALVADNFPITGPFIWQRAGTRIRDYTFRVTSDGEPICIGAHHRFVRGLGQLRRAFDAKPFWGKYLLLTASVSARRAGRVDMWIAAGATDPRPRSDKDIGRDIVAGGFKHVPITGDYQWRQVNFLIGPIPCMATAISYGVQLQGGGDVWLANPHIIEVPEHKLSPSMRKDRHGDKMLRDDPICRHQLGKERLWTMRGSLPVQVGDDTPLHPGLALLTKDENGYEPVRYDRAFPLGLIEF
jgi:hypothetical protein